MSTFSERLRKLRRMRGITQDELAAATGVSRSAIGMYENGAREPNFETLEAFADYFNVSMSDLVDSNIVPSATDEDLQMLKDNPDLRILLSAGSKLKKSDIEFLVQMARRMDEE